MEPSGRGDANGYTKLIFYTQCMHCLIKGYFSDVSCLGLVACPHTCQAATEHSGMENPQHSSVKSGLGTHRVFSRWCLHSCPGVTPNISQSTHTHTHASTHANMHTHTNTHKHTHTHYS